LLRAIERKEEAVLSIDPKREIVAGLYTKKETILGEAMPCIIPEARLPPLHGGQWRRWGLEATDFMLASLRSMGAVSLRPDAREPSTSRSQGSRRAKLLQQFYAPEPNEKMTASFR